MKIIYVNCGWRREYESDLRSNEHYSSSSENKGFESMTFANRCSALTIELTSQLEVGHYVGSEKSVKR